MKKVFLLLLISVSLNLFAQERSFNNLGVAEDSTFGLIEHSQRIEKLNNIIRTNQNFISENEDQVELMAIVGNSTEPINLPDRQWPDNVLTSINVIRSETGTPTYYAEYPSSESGDWFIGYRYYFDSTTDRVIAFERMANFFNSLCTSGVAKELSTYYFSATGELIAKSYSLVNNEGEHLSAEECYFNYDHQYRIAKTIGELIK